MKTYMALGLHSYSRREFCVVLVPLRFDEGDLLYLAVIMLGLFGIWYSRSGFGSLHFRERGFAWGELTVFLA